MTELQTLMKRKLNLDLKFNFTLKSQTLTKKRITHRIILTLKFKLMDIIPFSHNWNNKLSAKYYTTLRLCSAKYQVGKELMCTLNKKYIHTIQIQAITILTYQQLNTFIIGLDMGLELEQGKTVLRKMYPGIETSNQRLVLVLCKVVKVETDVNQSHSDVSKTLGNNSTEENNHTSQEQKEIPLQQHSHKLTESQIINWRMLDRLSMVYMLRQQNG